MRLDLLVQSFLRGTKKLQRLLSENLDALETCTSLLKSKTTALAILDQYQKADHLVSVVEILGKLNGEILICESKFRRTKVKKKTSKCALSKKLTRLQNALRNIIESNSPENWDSFINSMPSPPLTSNLSSRKVQKSPYPRNVTLLMPPIDISVMPPMDNEMPHMHGDKSDRYWSDEHHKFLKFPDKDWYSVIQENNLSYQSLHLVAPANFVTPTSPEYVTGTLLPWLTEQDVSKENFDIMREELERVLTRTRALQNKVWQAAELSVKIAGPKPSDMKEKRLSVSWQTRDSVRGFSRDSARSELSALHSSVRRSSWTSTSLPMVENVHWKDEQLMRDHERLTRVNIFQNYPQRSNRWTTAVPDPFRCLAQSGVATQGNLYHKTKLRLYIPETERKKCDVKRDLITPDSIFSAQSFRGAPSSMRFINKLKSREGGITRLHKGRIDFLVKNGLKSEIDSDRADAAHSLFHLGSLDSSSTLPALINVVNTDSSSIVKLHAAKALLNMGVCTENALHVFIGCLHNGSDESQIDLLEYLSSVQDIRSLFYECGNEKLHQMIIRILQEKSELLGENEKLAFLSAVCLVELCDVTDDNSAEYATKGLKSIALFSDDKDSRAKALESLTKSLDSCDKDIFDIILTDMKSAIIWRHRLSAALLLAYLGPDGVQQYISEEDMYEIIQRKVWDDPKREVRLGVSQAATALGMRPRLLEELDRYLRDSNKELRSQAVIAMSAVGIHSDATLRYLNEMLDLDESDYVRLQIIRTYQDLNLTDIRAIRAVRERERAGGPLGRAAQKLLKKYESRTTTPKSGRRSRRQREIVESRPSLMPWTADNTKDTPRSVGKLHPLRKVKSEGLLTDENTDKKRLALTSTAVRKSALKPGIRLPLAGASGTIIRA